jgi:pyruvate dehydrogenase complex dehydrogenase (E1) component
MKALAIKKEMHHAIDLIEDKDFLKAIHTILNEKSKEYAFELSEDEKKELDATRKQYKLGKSKSYTVAEVRKQAYSKLKK